MARPQLEIVHVGSACRDIDPADPRGWRLGGGVTYAALTTARLGLRTAAIVGADADAAASAELDTLRDAGVDVLVVPLEEGPVFHNVETPKGRVQTCIQRGVPLSIPTVPTGWLAAAGWSIVPVADEIPDAWADVIPTGAYVAVAWQGFLRVLEPGERIVRRAPRPSPILHRADLVGREPPRRAARDPGLGALRVAPSRRGPADHSWRVGRAAGGGGSGRTGRDGRAICRRRPAGSSTRPVPATRSSPPSSRRRCARRSPGVDGRAAASTFGSRRRRARWSSRGTASPASRTGPRSTCGGRRERIRRAVLPAVPDQVGIVERPD